MWRLFKEVFKSLSKNKVVVIGLSFLVFLTSAIFTLLSSMRTTLVGGFENYKQVSKLHDVSVDLNLPTQGNAYNEGYFVNGETADSLKSNNQKFYTPISYSINYDKSFGLSSTPINNKKEYFGSESNILYITNNDGFIKLSEIGELNPVFSDYYIKKDDLVNFYTSYRGEKNNNIEISNSEFYLDDIDGLGFNFKHETKVEVFEKTSSNKYINLTKKFVLEPNDSNQLFFDKQYSIGDIMSLEIINVGNDTEIYGKQLSSLYVNLKDKLLTFDFTLGNQWVDSGIGIGLTPTQVANLLSFNHIEKSKFIFKQNNINNNLSKFIDYEGSFQQLNENLKLNSFWYAKDIFGLNNNQETIQKQHYTFEANKKYLLKKEWIAKEYNDIEFLRWNYFTSFVDKNNAKNKWSGAFKTFIQTLGDMNSINRDDLWDKLESFSYWKKRKTNIIVPYDANGMLQQNNKLIKQLLLPLNDSNNYFETENLYLYTTDSRRMPNKSDTPYSISLQNAQTIWNIEKVFNKNVTKLSHKDFLTEISDENIKNTRFNFIKNKAYVTTQNEIINRIKNQKNNSFGVGEDNIGIRETLTVDGINETTNKKNVFHFINTGNEKNEIDGIQINVGKLYEEYYEPTLLNRNNSSKTNIFKTAQINPHVASMIIQSIGKNLYTDPDYIKPYYHFAKVVDNNPFLNRSKTLNNIKILPLIGFDLTKQTPTLEEIDQFNLGVIFVGNKFKIVTRLKNNNQFVTPEEWFVLYNDFFTSEGLDFGLFNQWMIKNKLTIGTEFIKTDELGWVKKDKLFENIYYIPLLFLSPKTELIQDALNNNKIDFLINSVEKFLLNYDLVKEKYLTAEQVYKLSKILKKVLNQNNFATVFSSGNFNKAILPKIGFDLVYELSHEQSGDLLKSILFSIIQQIKITLSDKGDLESQKQYLKNETNNLFNLIYDLTALDLNKYITANSLVELSKDPKIFISSLYDFISSINFAKLSEQAKLWFENENNSEVVVNSKTYYKKLTSAQIIKWVFGSLNQQQLKLALSKLIDNFNFSVLLDLNNTDGVLYNFLQKWNPSLISVLTPIISKLNNSNNLEAFDNVKTSLINIIKSIDFDILYEELVKSIKIKNYEFKKEVLNSQTNLIENKSFFVSVEQIEFHDGIIAFLKSIFKKPGSNRAFKQNLITMFNLSNETQELNITSPSGKKEIIFIPANDPNKLGFFDFANIFSKLLSAPQNTIYSNYDASIQLENILKKVSSSNSQESALIDLNIFSEKDKNFLNEFDLLNKTDTKKQFLDNLIKFQLFVNQTKGGTSLIIDDNKKTGADLLNDLQNFDSGLSFWQTLKKAISSVSNPIISNEFALGAQAFNIYLPWIKMFDNKLANFEESKKFVNDFLNLAIDNEILALAHKKAKGQNIPFFETTNFWLSEFLANPSQITLFDLKSNGKYDNSKIQNLIDSNPKFSEWVQQNKNMLILQLGYIASSKYYSYNSENPNGIYYTTINKFVKRYLQKDSFYSIRKQAIKLIQKSSISFPVEIFGISEAIINPILRFIFPEISISYLATQKQQPGKINGNLSYLLLNRLVNFEALFEEDSELFVRFKTFLYKSTKSLDTSSIPINIDNFEKLNIDGAYINKLKEISKSNKNNIFGFNFISLVTDLIDTIIEPKELKDVVFNNTNSYLAKVNYAYLKNNNKSIYAGDIPTNPIEMNQLINSLSDEFIINVNGVKFIIIGQETTVDYMYPVIDENNLQVDITNQALIYVNKLGFDRIHNAYIGNVVKKALLVKNSTKHSNVELKNHITKIVNSLIKDSGKLQRVFLTTEIDAINPERSLRITAVQKIISSISFFTIAIMIVFTFVVAISIIFIIQRYIKNKNKVIGILVAQGYKPSQISLSFTIFAMVTAVIGGILGYVIGNQSQYLVLSIFNSYWTVPKSKLPFDIISLFFTVFLPFIGMSMLIYIVSLISLRHKAIDLISGVNDVSSSKLFKKYQKWTAKKNVKKRFAFTLAFNSFWKLVSFGISVMLTGVATLFGVASNNIFNHTINKTYENRNYTFKVDLETPTIEGGLYKTFNGSNLYNNLYMPVGVLNENNREIKDYLKPGFSSVLNETNANGNPGYRDSHIMTQFSSNLTVAAGVAVDPWTIAYNSMPDSQKAKIDKIRDRVGYELEKTQGNYYNKAIKNKWVVDPKTNNIGLKNEKDEFISFFKYYKSPFEKVGNFKYALFDGTEYKMLNITTDSFRTEYREFLINGYKQLNERIQKEALEPNLIKLGSLKIPVVNNWLENVELFGPTINDYFISFGGVLFNDKTDEKYTYIKGNLQNNSSIKIYGYKQNSELIKLVDANKNNLYDNLYNYVIKDDIYPIVINQVVADKYHYSVGSKFTIDVQNYVDRYLNKLNNQNIKHIATFEVVGINPTYINEEYITTQTAANKLIGLDKLQDPNQPKINLFNGVATNNKTPIQVTDSTSLYSLSGYWSGYGSFDLESLDEAVLKSMYNQIFDLNSGLLKDFMKIDKIQDFVKNKDVKTALSEYANLYENKLYIALGASINSKDIEVGFTSQVGNTIGQITIGVIALSFIIALIILIIMATIMISENEKNIAIWSILGYTQKEKLTMFFGVFIPFILFFFMLCVPAVFALIASFNAALLSSSSIALPLTLKWWHVLLTFIFIITIFIITSLTTWISINKMKPVDLLKGK
ncbi:FtsX-like permease family protein [Mycoplasmopsis lipofaciens]|uniref:FtsX-like permease family protein n=1 Tax=Mycoplasmopsis lipofaciens TaxID=114884 RepID=UPI0004848F7E|nr:ABC transporter permease [Mycoplasmopsis lipofaciens]